MGCYVYILYSEKHNRFYCGISKNPYKRQRQHNRGYTPSTSHIDDWTCVFQEKLADYIRARKLEKRIKSRGAKRYLNDIKK